MLPCSAFLKLKLKHCFRFLSSALVLPSLDFSPVGSLVQPSSHQPIISWSFFCTGIISSQAPCAPYNLVFLANYSPLNSLCCFLPWFICTCLSAGKAPTLLVHFVWSIQVAFGSPPWTKGPARAEHDLLLSPWVSHQ
jgi:hypothetical protein